VQNVKIIFNVSHLWPVEGGIEAKKL